MDLQRKAKFGLSGRHALVCAVERGLSLRAAAVAFNVSPATAHRWWHRWLKGGRIHRGVGYDHLHGVVDDHTRIAYVGLHPREDAETDVCTLERALRYF